MGQLTSVLSITHRTTGLIQSAMLSAVGLGAVALPGSFPTYLAMMQDMHYGLVVIFATKFILAWPVFFHLFNGFRHLAWDLGRGLKLPEIYKTGWTAVTLATLTTLIVAAL